MVSRDSQEPSEATALPTNSGDETSSRRMPSDSCSAPKTRRQPQTQRTADALPGTASRRWRLRSRCRFGRAGELHRVGAELLLVMIAEVPFANGVLRRHRATMCAIRTCRQRSNLRPGRFPSGRERTARARRCSSVERQRRIWSSAAVRGGSAGCAPAVPVRARVRRWRASSALAGRGRSR